MRRTASFLALILIGGLAAGLGTYTFLKRANADRARLAEIALKAQEESKTATETSQRTIEEANRKLEKANAEITKAQQAIHALQEERAQMTNAVPLSPPASRVLKEWQEAVNVGLGVSLKFPPTSLIETNDASALTIAKLLPSGMAPTRDARWLAVMPYDNRLETELLAHFATSTPVVLLIDGRLLIGARGSLTEQSNEIYVLRVQNAGRSTHLIWASRPEKNAGQMLLTALATLSFAK